MPNDRFHRGITAQALLNAGVTDARELAENCCTYPDYFFSDRYPEIAPCMYFLDGIQFHYPPDTPVEEFYRYWTRDENGNRPVSTQENGNIRHVESGVRFYLEKTVELLKAGNRSEAWKFLGCLLHFLEDSSSGIHTLEGADGTDLFVLDRLSGKDVAKYICTLPMDPELFRIKKEPQIISDDIEETTALLYQRYAAAAASSRKALFNVALNFITDQPLHDVELNHKIMIENTLQLVTDTIATIMAIVENRAPRTPERRLNEFAPFHYPIGGSGGFALRRYEEKENTFSFGVNAQVALLYRIPENLYRSFTASVRGNDIKQVTLHLISGGREVNTIKLESNTPTPVEIENPGGVTGFRISSREPAGSITISDGIFHKI